MPCSVCLLLRSSAGTFCRYGAWINVFDMIPLWPAIGNSFSFIFRAHAGRWMPGDWVEFETRPKQSFIFAKGELYNKKAKHMGEWYHLNVDSLYYRSLPILHKARQGILRIDPTTAQVKATRGHLLGPHYRRKLGSRRRQSGVPIWYDANLTDFRDWPYYMPGWDGEKSATGFHDGKLWMKYTSTPNDVLLPGPKGDLPTESGPPGMTQTTSMGFNVDHESTVIRFNEMPWCLQFGVWGAWTNDNFDPQTHPWSVANFQGAPGPNHYPTCNAYSYFQHQWADPPSPPPPSPPKPPPPPPSPPPAIPPPHPPRMYSVNVEVAIEADALPSATSSTSLIASLRKSTIASMSAEEQDSASQVGDATVAVSGDLTIELLDDSDATRLQVMAAAREQACHSYTVPGSCTVTLVGSTRRRLAATTLTIKVTRPLVFPHAPPAPPPPPRPPNLLGATYSYEAPEVPTYSAAANEAGDTINAPISTSAATLLSTIAARTTEALPGLVDATQTASTVSEVSVSAQVEALALGAGDLSSEGANVQSRVASELGIDNSKMTLKKIDSYRPPMPPPALPPKPGAPPMPPHVPPMFPNWPPTDRWYTRVDEGCDPDCYGGCIQSMWSNIYTWGDDGFPGWKSNVTVKRCRTVVVDVNVNVEMMSLTVYGTLLFQNRRDLLVNLRSVCVNIKCVTNHTTGLPMWGYCGKIIAGSPEEPFQGQLRFYTKGDDLTTTIPNCGGSGPREITVQEGASLELYGRRPARMWTRLRATVEAGVKALAVLGEIDWTVGDQVFVPSTDPRARTNNACMMGACKGDDVGKIVGTRKIPALDEKGNAIAGEWDTELLLAQPLLYKHVSAIETHNGFTLDMRVEVALYESAPDADRPDYHFNIIVDASWLNHWDFRFREFEGTMAFSGAYQTQIEAKRYSIVKLSGVRFYSSTTKLSGMARLDVSNCLFKSFIGAVGGYRSGSANTCLGGTSFIDNVAYRYHWMSAFIMKGNFMANGGGPNAPIQPMLFGGYQWNPGYRDLNAQYITDGEGNQIVPQHWEPHRYTERRPSLTGNAICGHVLGVHFGGGGDRTPGQEGFQIRDFSNNTAHHIERGVYCDGNHCGNPDDPITGITIWQSNSAFYLYARGATVDSDDPQRGMPTIANIATADCSWCIFFAGLSGEPRKHEIRYTGFAISNSLLLGQSDSNPGVTGRAFNLGYFMSEARTVGMAPGQCQNLGGNFYEQGMGADRFLGSPLGLGGETRITDVTLLRFTETMRMNEVGRPKGTEGYQPHYFKGITIDEQSRSNLIYFPPTEQNNMAKFDGNCLHRDCDGKRKTFIHDLDGSLLGEGAQTSLLAVSHRLTEYVNRWGEFSRYFIPSKMLYDPCPYGNDPSDP